MRHRKSTAKLGRKGEHRNAMLANLVCSLIRHRRITTTLAKAKAARPVAEKMVTLGKKNTLHARRLAAARLKYDSLHMLPTKKKVAAARKNDVIRILFSEIAPAFTDRNGGYTRIIKLDERRGDAAQLAILEWVDSTTQSSEELPAKSEKTEKKPEDKPEEKPAETAETKTEEASGETK